MKNKDFFLNEFVYFILIKSFLHRVDILFSIYDGSFEIYRLILNYLHLLQSIHTIKRYTSDIDL